MPNRDDIRVYQAASLLTQLGLTVAVPLVAGIAGGVWLDRKWAFAPAGVLIGLFGGLAVGIFGAWQILKSMLD